MPVLIGLANSLVVAALLYLALEIVLRTMVHGRRGRLAGLLALWLLFSIFFFAAPSSGGLWVSPWLLTLLILGLAVVLSRPRAPIYRLLWQIVRREGESADFAAARKAAGKAGQVIELGPLTLWTDADLALAERLSDILAATLAAGETLLGPDLPAIKPLRVICFAERESLRRYHGRLGPAMEMTAGYYTGLWHKRIVVTVAASGGFERLAAHELAHHLAYCLIGRRHLEPPWASEGMASFVEAMAVARLGDDRQASVVDARARVLRAALRRGELPGSAALLGTRRLSLSQWSMRDEDLASYRKTVVFYLLSTALIEQLHEEQPEATRQFFRAKPWRGNLKVFRQHFGDPGPIFEAILASLEAVPNAPAAPPAEFRSKYDDLLRSALDPEVEARQRRQTMRQLGATGMAGDLRGLAGLVDDPVWGEEARAVFEHLSGEAWAALDREALPGLPA